MLATLVVDSTGDASDADTADMRCDDGSGNCTLRAAIEQANADAGADTIEFQIAGAGPHTIQPASVLPVISDPLVIDGTTQPGFAGRPIVEINGGNAGIGVVGLHISSGGSTVRGLVVNRFSGDAIMLETGGDNVLEQNFIGTDVTGTAALGSGGNGVAIVNGSISNRIGTNGDGVNDSAEGNLISANGQSGVRIIGAGTDGNVVAGNLIGTDVTGSAALGNTFDAVAIQAGAQRNRIGTNGDGVADEADRNIPSASRRFQGVAIFDPGTNENVVAGNFIGTDATGTIPLGNGDNGILIFRGAQSNRIGTNGDEVADLAERNLISSNLSSGVRISDIGTDANVVPGNLIGTDVTGVHPLGNVADAVTIQNGAQRNVIGNNGDGLADALERNILSASSVSRELRFSIPARTKTS